MSEESKEKPINVYTENNELCIPKRYIKNRFCVPNEK